MKSRHFLFLITCFALSACGKLAPKASPSASPVGVLSREAVTARLPEDSNCRIRYLANENFHVFLGNADVKPDGFTDISSALDFINKDLGPNTCTLLAEPCDVQISQGYWILLNNTVLYPTPYLRLEGVTDVASLLLSDKICSAFVSKRCTLAQDMASGKYLILRENPKRELSAYGDDRFDTASTASLELSKLRVNQICSH